MNFDKLKKQELVSILSFLLSSISFMFLYFADYQKNNFTKILGYILPSIFWLGLIIAIVIQILLYRKLKVKVDRNQIGIISFFKNRYAIVFDILTILLTIVTIILLIKNVNNFITFLIISLLIISFEMHCVFNGKYFNYILTEEEKKNE